MRLLSTKREPRAPSKAADDFSLEVSEHDLRLLYMSAVTRVESSERTTMNTCEALPFHRNREAVQMIDEGEVRVVAIVSGITVMKRVLERSEAFGSSDLSSNQLI